METTHSTVQQADFKGYKPVQASNPMQTILIVYDGAISFLNKALEYAEKGDIKNKNIYTNKAGDIIVELNNCLDMDAGGEISENLRNLYVFTGRLLVEAITKNSAWALKEVVKILTGLKESWTYVADRAEEINGQTASGFGN